MSTPSGASCLARSPLCSALAAVSTLLVGAGDSGNIGGRFDQLEGLVKLLRRTTESIALGCLVAIVCAACSGSAARPTPTPQPGPSVAATDPFADCSYSGSDTLTRHVTFEPSAAIGGPLGAQLVVALYYQGYLLGSGMNGGLGFVLATSRNGGATWTDHPLPFGYCAGNGRLDKVGNGRVSVGPDGTTYVAAGAGDGKTPIRLVLTASPDGGETWTAPTFETMSTTDCHADEPSITADQASPGRAYAVWSDACYPNQSVVGISTTSDGGRTWSPARDIPLAGYQWANWPTIVSDPASPGTLRLFFSECRNTAGPEYSVVTATSSDGGASWSNPAVVAGGPGTYGPDPSAALSPDRSLYVAWDTDQGILFSRSQDTGATWSSPQLVDAQSYRRASLAVNSEGSVAIIFEPNSLIVSDDGGRTFANPVQISDLPIPQGFIGDYTMAALADGADFHAIFECTVEGLTSTCFW